MINNNFLAQSESRTPNPPTRESKIQIPNFLRIPPPPPPARSLPPNVIPLKNIPGIEFKSHMAVLPPLSSSFPLVPPPPSSATAKRKNMPLPTKLKYTKKKPKMVSTVNLEAPRKPFAKKTPSVAGETLKSVVSKHKSNTNSETINRIIDCYIEKIRPPPTLTSSGKKANFIGRQNLKKIEIVPKLIVLSDGNDSDENSNPTSPTPDRMNYSNPFSNSLKSPQPSSDSSPSPKPKRTQNGTTNPSAEFRPQNQEPFFRNLSGVFPNDEESNLPELYTNGGDIAEVSVRLLRPRRYEYKKPQIGPEHQVDPEMIPALGRPESAREHCGRLIAERISAAVESAVALSQTAPKRKKEGLAADSVGGRVVWRAGVLKGEVVDRYLRKVKRMFPEKIARLKKSNREIVIRPGYCVEKALFLLHSCDYNVKDALSHIKLTSVWNTENDPFSEKDEIPEEEACFVCGDGGSLLLCDYKICRRVFHARCAKITKIPEGEWQCPTHFCAVCQEPSDLTFACSYCSNAYCANHVPDKCVSETNETQNEFICNECLESEVNPQARFEQRFVESMRRRRDFVRSYRVGGVELNYYDLYCAVISLGGARLVTDYMWWSRVRKMLQIPDSSTNASSLLKSIYTRILFPYEQLYYAKSLGLSINEKGKKGRPKTKSLKVAEIASNETCDIIITGYTENCLKIEANVNGSIKNGFLFLPKVVEEKNKRPGDPSLTPLNIVEQGGDSKPSFSSASPPASENDAGSPNGALNGNQSRPSAQTDKTAQTFADAAQKTELKPTKTPGAGKPVAFPIEPQKTPEDMSFYRAVKELAEEISQNGTMHNPNFDTALEARFALKKTAMSHNALAKLIQIGREELNQLLHFEKGARAGPHKNAAMRVRVWLDSLPENVRSSVRSAVENFKFKEMTKLENLKLRRRKTTDDGNTTSEHTV